MDGHTSVTMQRYCVRSKIHVTIEYLFIIYTFGITLALVLYMCCADVYTLFFLVC
jgi:hypothetical protein